MQQTDLAVIIVLGKLFLYPSFIFYEKSCNIISLDRFSFYLKWAKFEPPAPTPSNQPQLMIIDKYIEMLAE